jgi:predicted dehydrogenase
VALLGAGMQGEVLLNACMKMGPDSGVRFVAVCDLWENLTLSRVLRVLERYGQEAKGYVDYRDMLDQEKDLDAVLIATPDFVHAEQTAACLKAGLHVYCEAPMSNTQQGASSMVQAAEETGKVLQIGQQRRSNPRYRHCQVNLLNMAQLLGHVTAAGAQWNLAARSDRGWSRRREIDPAVLERYGYESMHQFKNWMQYRDMSAGPAGSYGVHQLDVMNWFLGAMPRAVTARGGTYYYDQDTHQWPDTLMAILEYETKAGPVCASYQTLTNNGYGGHVEVFMGDQGTLEISESVSRSGVYRDPQAPDWDKWVRLDFLQRPGEEKTPQDDSVVMGVEETKPPSKYAVPVTMQDPYPVPHLRNFFGAVRGSARLTCPPRIAYAAIVTALKINEALATGHRLPLTDATFAI